MCDPKDHQEAQASGHWRLQLVLPYSHVTEDCGSFYLCLCHNFDRLSCFWHITKIRIKTSCTLGFIHRIVNSTSVKARNLAYKSFVRPQLEYCGFDTPPATELLWGEVPNSRSGWKNDKKSILAVQTGIADLSGWTNNKKSIADQGGQTPKNQ